MDDRRADILAMLDDIERAEHVRILWAGEAGSRAWGTATPESDYDVRFVYVHELEAYLSLDPRHTDTASWRLDGTFDVSGWDLRKYLQLAHRGNISVFEWGNSPTVYRAAPEWRGIWAAVQPYFSCKAALHSYSGIAHSACEKYLQPGVSRVPCKEYLRVARSLLACRFVAERGACPPVRLADLVSQATGSALAEGAARLVQHRAGGRGRNEAPRIPELDAAIEADLPRFDGLARMAPDDRRSDWKPLDCAFRAALGLEVSR